jgi:hypothetical protein
MTTTTRDQTEHLLKRLNHYSEIKNERRKVSDHTDKLMKTFVREAFGLSSKRIKGNTLWTFKDDSDVSTGDLSASRVSSILIKYRNSIKTLGAVHADFESSLSNARALMAELGAPEADYKGLKASVKTETLLDRIGVLSKKYRSANSHQNAAQIRAVVNFIEIFHPFYYKLSSPLRFVKAIANDKNKTALTAKHKKRVSVNAEFIYKKATSVLENPSDHDWVDMTISLCALTGRRPTEIMKTAKFAQNNDRENYVIFNGVLKSRDRKLDNDFGDWAIPVIGDPDLIIKSLKTLRTKLGKAEKDKTGGVRGGGLLTFTTRNGKTVKASIFDKRYVNDADHNEAINQMYNGTLNERVRKWLNTGDFDVHSLRAIYTKYIDQREEDLYPESYESRTTRILCYSTQTLSEAVKHYAALKIDNSIDTVEVYQGDVKQDVKKESNDLLKKLEKAAPAIDEKSKKAKKLTAIQDWALIQCERGLTEKELTVSYIRKHCKVGGRSVNADTAGLYLVLCNLVEEMETQTMIYTKNIDGKWLVMSKKTNEQKLLY